MFVVGGESLIDLKAEVALPGGELIGRDGQNQIVMTAHPGGSPYNCAIALAKLMDGVEVFEPDWDDIEENLTSYIDAWKEATGS